jgi:hypothetical protein
MSDKSKKMAKKNQHLRRVRKALRHAEKRKLSKYRIERISEHIAAVSAGRRPNPHPLRDAYQKASREAQQAALSRHTRSNKTEDVITVLV